jgi:hypothetical protein
MAAAIHTARQTTAGLPDDVLVRRDGSTALDLYALLEPDSEWAIGQAGLDLLGASLSDEPPFGRVMVSRPMEFRSRILLHVRVGVPTASAEVLHPRLERAMAAMIREALGPEEANVPIVVEPAEDAE